MCVPEDRGDGGDRTLCLWWSLSSVSDGTVCGEQRSFLKNISKKLVQFNEFALNTSQIVLFQFDDVVPFQPFISLSFLDVLNVEFLNIFWDRKSVV